VRRKLPALLRIDEGVLRHDEVPPRRLRSDAGARRDVSLNAEFVVLQKSPKSTCGGSFFIHLPLHIFPGGRFASIARALYAGYRQLNRAQAFLRVQLMSLGLRPPIRGVSYEMDRLLADLRKIGFVDLQIVMAPVGSPGEPNPCVYRRKR
jgi:hypothetical protein